MQSSRSPTRGPSDRPALTTERPDRGSDDGPLLVAGPDTLLLQVDHPRADAARAALAAFAELERSPGHVHTYRLTDLGLWNAKAAGLDATEAVESLREFAAGPVPRATVNRIVETMGRFGRIIIETVAGPDADSASAGPESESGLAMTVDDIELFDELLAERSVSRLTGDRLGPTSVSVEPGRRGRLKQVLTELRWPADDRAALSPGVEFDLALRPEVELRPYQRQAVDSWRPSGTGVVVLPCGAGKTITAIAASAEVGTNTLILVTSQASLTQWDRELRRFTTVDPDDIGHYSARRKRVRPITVATYQVMATKRDGRFRHIEMIQNGDWGLVVYDEVHLLPSAVFGLTAGIQARRRLGLTATLIREDGREDDVFTLVGPKRFDVPWSDLELQGWIAPARCIEVRVVADDSERLAHARAGLRAKAAVAGTVTAKQDVVSAILDRHPGEATLIIGTYLDGLEPIAERFGLPIVTGKTAARERMALFDQLREGAIDALVVSKVANFSLDLPEVSVAIQVSGTFGSRQEEAQRLGRILRPKHDGRQAHFYSLITRDTVEQEHGQRRQRFLTEQGYHYEIVDAERLLEPRRSDPDHQV
ncbi:MAG: DNA repair helicase XPB [Acidimicrobiales bacterium]